MSLKKAKEVYVRLGIPDYVYTKEEYDKGETPDLPENAWLVGYEDEDGNECDEDGVYLNQEQDE